MLPEIAATKVCSLASLAAIVAAGSAFPASLLRPRVLVTDQKLSDAYDILTLLEALLPHESKDLGSAQ